MSISVEFDVNHSDFAQVMVPNYAPDAFIPVRGEGAYIWDQNGRKYLDFTSGIAVCALGHCHPALNQVLQQQAAKLWHISNIYTNEPALKLAKNLVDTTCAEKVFFANSGSEANEAAFKLARRYGTQKYGAHKHEIIAADNSFHGRTLFTVNVGGQPNYSSGFGPKIDGITHVAFNDINALKQTISNNTCAVVLELIQGESGVLPADYAYIKQVRQLCDEHNVLFIIDEVQTGMGRTGTLFAYQDYAIKPDIFTSAKGLGGGFPIAAMLTSSEIAQYLPVGSHGSTYGGNPLGCAVADAVLNIVKQPQVLANVKTNGDLLQNELTKLNQKQPIFKEIRGKGLLVGGVLTDEFSGKASLVRKYAADVGLMLLQAGNNVVRFAPNLLIKQNEISQAISLLDEALYNLKQA